MRRIDDDRADRALLVSLKVCTCCRIRDARPNRQMCQTCGELAAAYTAAHRTTEQNRAHVKAYRAVLVEAKLCIRCRKVDARKNRRTCMACGIRDAKRSASWRNSRPVVRAFLRSARDIKPAELPVSPEQNGGAR